MYNQATILEEFKDLVGWRQPLDPSIDDLGTDLKTSTSGLFYQSQHPSITIQALKGISPDFDSFVFATFDPLKSDYKLGDIVDENGNLFIRLLSDSVQPTSNSAYWRTYIPFNEWLRQKTNDAILQCVNDWLDIKSEMRTAKDVIMYENVFFYSENQYYNPPGQGVRGLKIRTAKELGIQYNIPVLRARFETDQTINIKVFESGKAAPIFETSIVHTGDYTDENVNLTLDSQKTYWITYDGAVNIDAVNESDIVNYNDIFSIKGFINQSGDTSQLWNTTFDQEYLNECMGIEFPYISVSCDYTDVIVRNKKSFAAAVAKRVALNLLNEFRYNASARVNRHEKVITNSGDIVFDMEGDTQATRGNNNSLNAQYTRALKSIMFDKTGISSICLPCKKKGIKHGRR